MIPEDRERARSDARKLSDHLYRAEGTSMPRYLRESSEAARTALEMLVWAVNQYERDLTTGRDATDLALHGEPVDMPNERGTDIIAHLLKEWTQISRASKGQEWDTPDPATSYVFGEEKRPCKTCSRLLALGWDGICMECGGLAPLHVAAVKGETP